MATDQKQSPIEIARQTLMQLTQRKIPPTPDNFRSVYDEIAGTRSVDKSQELGKTLEKVLFEAGKHKPKYIAVAQAMAPLIEKGDWNKLEDQLRKLFPAGEVATVGEVNWSVLIRSLLKQMEVSHKGVTLSRKKEGLSRVLSNFGSDPDVLGQKIQALMSSWGMGTPATDSSGPPLINSEVETLQTASPSQTNTLGSSGKQTAQWRDMLLRTFELVLIPYLESSPEQQQKAVSLLAKLQQANTEQALIRCGEELKPLLLTLEMQRDGQQRIQESLLQLLRLVVSSMGELVIEDKWLFGQITVINDIVAKPLNINTLYDAESSLKGLIYKQS
ncbi:MAG: GGDEF domain-containing protein, partial [Methylophilaceae bacterium]